MNTEYEDWMRTALEEAAIARDVGELPIGGLLIGGNKILQRTQTSVVREGSIIAHGELMVLLRAKDSIWASDRPLTLVTTLEPCLMCLGAAMQCQVDRVVYGMRCAPDGGTIFASTVASSGQNVPEIVGPVLEDECVHMFQSWPQPSTHHAYGYVSSILNAYGVSLSREEDN